MCKMKFVMKRIFFVQLCLAALFFSCERVDITPAEELSPINLDELAQIFAGIELGQEQMNEVYDAVSSSSENGYDEEYLMSDLFKNPGAGIGDAMSKAAGKTYSKPMRELLREALELRQSTRTSFDMSVEDYLKALTESDVQIYWPYSELWDGKSYPVITYHPGDDSEMNTGYRFVKNPDGGFSFDEVLVDEELAKERPVWVINRNNDSEYVSLELLRRQDPDWGNMGGEIIVGRTKSSSGPYGKRMLVLKSITMLRHYDSWFAGGSEFVIQMGSLDGFYASTEAELKLYYPNITNFTIVVKRKYLGVPVNFNAVLVSDWTDQIENCALLVTEDDGGTQTSWKCSAVCKIKSKSYGFDLELPYRQSDDLVWRGQLSASYIEANNAKPGHFGGVDLCFELIDY